MTRILIVIVLAMLVGMAAGLAFVVADRTPAPAVVVNKPRGIIGVSSELDLSVTSPGGGLSALEAVVEQRGARLPLFSIADPGRGEVEQVTPDELRVRVPIGRTDVPGLAPGPARLVITATRSVLFGLRTRVTRVAADLEVRFEPPRVAALSTHHYINHGGAELVVYQVTPADTESGVQVGERFYPGYPATATGVAGAAPGVKVAFFALLPDQDLGEPIAIVARDEGGNEARAAFDHRVFPKRFRRSRIDVSDGFLLGVVPAIVERSAVAADLVRGLDTPVARFLAINGDLRRRDAETIAAIGARTAPVRLWRGAFHQLSNAKVESAFADHRTYFAEGREIDQQVHLGFDLAVTANVRVVAANRGTVVFADYLGIYGNCVIVDHGLGVQSLYAHLSSIAVRPGDEVDALQEIGRTGMTGLAGGDHLHFTMLVQGQPVNPVEWWDAHWIEDRIERKLRDAAANPPAQPASPGR